MIHQALKNARGWSFAALAVALFATQSATAAKPDFPELNLPEAAGGQKAIEMLGARLPEVAHWYGKTAEEFAAILNRDSSARLDRKGRLFYVEGYTVEHASTAGGSGVSEAASFPLEQTFLLHSRPGAQRTIYLDFDGHTTTGTAWNAGYGINSISSPPYDFDGVPFSFSQLELERIQRIWQRVAEDYAPFDVDVTTEEPPADALTRSGSGDLKFGTRVVVTRDFVPGGCGCGGFAYVGIFDSTTDYYKPAFVFYDHLGNGHEKYVAESIAHEAGHNVGLHHDGSSSTGYYAGHGTGETGWAPIMGVGYYQSLVQWSKGEYPGANNHEDDFVVMQSNELPLRADDHGNSPGTASPMSAGQNPAGSGVIERASDVDVFKFNAAPGAASFALSFDNPSPNLDSQLDLLDAGGNLLATANPVDQLGASLSAVLPAAGTYFLRVSGVGKGDPLAGGYSDYGSLGQYQVSGSVQTATAQGQFPVAVATATPASGEAPLAVTLSGTGSYDPDGSIVSWVWDFGDGSAPVSGATAAHSYAQGNYLATLTVTDNDGLSDSSSVAISSNPPAIVPLLHVQSITITVQANKRNSRAVATVQIRDGSGNPVGGALVVGTWSGVVSGSSSATTDAAGVATLNSSRARAGGTFTFTVTDVQLSGYSYSPADNVETSDSGSN